MSFDGGESQGQFDAAVRTGIMQGRIEAAFQPLVTLATQQIRAWEVLVRLRDPELGSIAAMTIVAAAKRMGMLDDMTDQLAAHAFDTLTAARDTHGVEATFSINFEREQLESWTPTLEHLLSRSRAEDVKVALEISERSFDDWTDTHTKVITQVRDSGGAVSLDDFGTGFAGLGQLHIAPFQVVKLDKSLVAGIDNERHRLVLRRTIELLLELEFHVLVEGIESAEEAEILQELGAEYGQGYHFGRPIDAAALMERSRLHGSAGVAAAVS